MAATYHNITTDDGTTVFYREAGSPSIPTLLLLHGFPSSSIQFRNLIPTLSEKHHIIAPDLPGYGFTKVPPGYKYTFDNLATTISSFLRTLGIKTFSMYIFDYGAPIGIRLSLSKEFAVKSIISQNGNAYEEGFGQEFWAPIFRLWKDNSLENRKWLIDNFLTLEATKYQYVQGVSQDRLNRIAPESYAFDYEHIVQTPGNMEAQVDLFYDYRKNPESYPAFHAWLKASEVPVLAVWGAGDPCFIPPGAKAFENDAKDAEVHLLEGAGHFALETHGKEIGELVLDFLGRKV